MSDAPPPAALRLDKWLWFARCVKTRGLAQDLCQSGHVVLNGATVRKASAVVRPGDRLEITAHDWRRRLEVVALGSRRGPAPEAQALYRETAPPERVGVVLGAVESRDPGTGRPTKRDRRALDRLKGGGDL